jgi:CDP-Glycerol:Poly(glycerophosphate) glycerophosphotransferase
LQNAAALLTMPPYLMARPFLGGGSSTVARWVISGHSGRVYADNAAALHQLLCEQERDVTWISADAELSRMLTARRAKVLTRNSFAARRAIEHATVLAYSHGPSDLDHRLVKQCELPGLRVHLNHCLALVKAERTEHRVSSQPDHFLRAPASDPFDYMLASSERERANLQRSFPGAGSRVVLGGGAHLDAFMRARGQQPARTIAYFPTFRDTREGARQLEGVIRQLVADDLLHQWLQDEDFELVVLGHINTPTGRAEYATSGRVRFASAQRVGDELLRCAALISDYSGAICDYLAVDRPLIFFPFDKQEYLRTRPLHVGYDELVCGPEVHDVPALVELIVSGRFQERTPYEVRRRYWEAELFPQLEPSYARRTLDTIEMLVAQRAERARNA